MQRYLAAGPGVRTLYPLSKPSVSFTIKAEGKSYRKLRSANRLGKVPGKCALSLRSKRIARLGTKMYPSSKRSIRVVLKLVVPACKGSFKTVGY